MTDKRFIIVDLLETLAIADDTECKYYQNSNDDFKKLCEPLNELHDENQLVKDTLNELKSIDGFWDSALLQGYISKIANILGVDLE